ncbi:MAG: nucleotidyltransferase [Planctomycetota bacterium]|jgi:predicted nucleotidyltransferase
MIEKLIKNIAQRLDQEKIPYMIIGGQAVLLYGRPRLTRDIDITLGIDTDKFALIEGVYKNLNLKPLAENPQDFARDTKVLPTEEPESKVRVDFIFSFTPYEARAIKRAKQVLLDDYPAKFASCEDVIIHKMVAGRAIDDEDVKSILAKNKDTIDFKYIEKWLSEFGKIAEHEGILAKFNNLLKKRT